VEAEPADAQTRGAAVSDRFELVRTFRFEAAHYLPRVADGHPCQRVHGHSYEVELRIAGSLDQTTGWVVDFAAIDDAFAPLRDRLDHRLLNEVDGLENPTSEVLSRWVWQAISTALPGVVEVVVRETPRSACIYRGPG
jgi:6-pyruvoyltetrahydropterin/6-carboxytetrahydropterin synthase